MYSTMHGVKLFNVLGSTLIALAEMSLKFCSLKTMVASISPILPFLFE